MNDTPPQPPYVRPSDRWGFHGRTPHPLSEELLLTRLDLCPRLSQLASSCLVATVVAMETTPKDLAKQLGVTGRTLRGYVRSKYRPNGEDKYSRWKLDDAMVTDVARHFSDR